MVNYANNEPYMLSTTYNRQDLQHLSGVLEQQANANGKSDSEGAQLEPSRTVHRIAQFHPLHHKRQRNRIAKYSNDPEPPPLLERLDHKSRETNSLIVDS